MITLTRLKERVGKLKQRVPDRARSVPPRRLPLAQWAEKYLEAKTNDGLTPLTPQCELHTWLCSELDTFATKRGQRLNVLAPRGSAKTTWATFAYPLRAALHGEEPFIVLTSDTSDQAQAYLDDIRQQLEIGRAHV